MIQAVRDVLVANDPAPYLAAYRVFATADADLAGGLDQIACPTLVITGAQDGGSTPQMADLMCARIPGAEKVIVPGFKHMLPVEGAPAFTAAVRRFLAAHPLQQEGE